MDKRIRLVSISFQSIFQRCEVLLSSCFRDHASFEKISFIVHFHLIFPYRSRNGYSIINYLSIRCFKIHRSPLVFKIAKAWLRSSFFNSYLCERKAIAFSVFLRLSSFRTSHCFCRRWMGTANVPRLFSR